MISRHIRLLFNAIIIVAALSAPVVTYAQDYNQFFSYSVDDGLPQSSIWDITQDRNGFLWIGTSDGLCRFDGYAFTVYKNDPKDSNSICSNRDHRFYTDRQGNLWVISWNGISLYNDRQNNFSNLYVYRPHQLADNFNTLFGEDDQYIWAGLAYRGIARVDKKTHSVTILDHIDGLDIRSISVWTAGILANGRLWLCTELGLLVYDIKTGHCIKREKEIRFSAIINLSDSTVVACNGKIMSLIDKRVLTLHNIPLSEDVMDKDVLFDIIPLSDHEMLLANHKGLFTFDIASKKITGSIRSFDPLKKNKYAYVQCIYRGRSGNLWVGTNGDGLKRINFPFKKFRNYNSHSELSNLVKAIYADSQKLYVGYFENGLDQFDRKKGFEKNCSIKERDISPVNHVYAVSALSGQQLLLYLAQRNNIYTYNTATSVFQSYEPVLKKAVQSLNLEATNYPFILKLRNGQCLSINGQLLFALNEPGKTTIKVSLLHSFDGEMLCCGHENERGTIFMGTLNCAYYGKSGVWKRIELPENVHVKSICSDKNGNTWIGTVRGLYVLDSAMKITRHYTEENGLSNQFIYGILCDDDGNMWFSHNKGISVCYRKTGRFRHYYKDDGLQSSEFNTNAYYKSADGMLFFGGINGVTGFYPREINDNPNVPEVKITNIRLFESAYKTDLAPWNVHEITLPYNRNSLSFEFAANEYTNPKQNKYAYIMESLDNTWIQAGDKRFARYPALPPGHYTFKVKAANNDGIWQEKPTTISITIVPPYWQQWWFRLLSVLLLIAGIAGVILRIQKQRHLRQIRAMELQQKIQLERERISRDLHDTVGTQLSLISNNIEWVAHPLKIISEKEKSDKLEFVNNTARDIIATLRETIWALKKQEISIEEFSDKLKAFVQKQLATFTEITLSYDEEISESIILGPSEALNLFRICQEAIANVLKYAEASVLEVQIVARKGKYTVFIRDNGKGFDQSKTDPLVQNGLENMKHRANDIGTGISITSELNKGTNIIVTKK